MSLLGDAYRVAGSLVSPLAIAFLRLSAAIHTRGRARMVVQNESGKVLLVSGVISRHQYTLPGGGIEKGETALDAAVRELREETGIIASQAEVRQLCYLSKRADGAPYDATVFYNKLPLSDDPVAYNRRELKAAIWVSLSAVPEAIDPITQKSLAILSSRA